VWSMLKSERSRLTAGGYVWSGPVEASAVYSANSLLTRFFSFTSSSSSHRLRTGLEYYHAMKSLARLSIRTSPFLEIGVAFSRLLTAYINNTYTIEGRSVKGKGKSRKTTRQHCVKS
jgi:hypothetical protein